MLKHRLNLTLFPEYSKHYASFEKFVSSDVSKMMDRKRGRWALRSHNHELTISFSHVRDLLDYEEHIGSLKFIQRRKDKNDVSLALDDFCFVETTIVRNPYYGVRGIGWLSAVESRKATLIAKGHDPDDISINDIAVQGFWDELQRHTVGLKLKRLGSPPTWSDIQKGCPHFGSFQFYTIKDATTFKEAVGAKKVLKFTPVGCCGASVTDLP